MSAVWDVIALRVDCEIVLEPSAWKSVYMTVGHANLPSTPPRLNDIIRMVALLGGYVQRKSTKPGPQAL